MGCGMGGDFELAFLPLAQQEVVDGCVVIVETVLNSLRREKVNNLIVYLHVLHL